MLKSFDGFFTNPEKKNWRTRTKDNISMREKKKRSNFSPHKENEPRAIEHKKPDKKP